jgi:hypothetical protein
MPMEKHMYQIDGESLNKMRNTIILLIFVFILTVSCGVFREKKIEIVYYNPIGLRGDKGFNGSFEDIEHAIFRYSREDSLHFVFKSTVFLYAPDKRDIPEYLKLSHYVRYIPALQSGVLGIFNYDYTYKNPVQDSVVPLYQFWIRDTLISFSKMKEEEQTRDVWRFKDMYNNAYDYAYFSTKENPDMIFYQEYRIIHEYLNGKDTLYNVDLYVPPFFAHIPMFDLPAVYMYYKNQPVKKRIGFYPIISQNPDHTADYRHEVDTALLALPVRIFQEKYLQTRNIDCLDGLNIHIK